MEIIEYRSNIIYRTTFNMLNIGKLWCKIITNTFSGGQNEKREKIEKHT